MKKVSFDELAFRKHTHIMLVPTREWMNYEPLVSADFCAMQKDQTDRK